MKLLIPIRNLIIENVIKLGEVILVPCYFINSDVEIRMDKNINDSEVSEISGFIKLYYEFIKQCGENHITLAWIDITDEFNSDLDKKSFLENKCETVNSTLDYIRINYCRFDRKEMLPSIPGVLGLYKEGILFDNEAKKLEVIIGNEYNFLIQPGIGVECNVVSPVEDNYYLYGILFTNREDEVYREYRFILGNASKAMHIDDINICFTFLLSMAERMASREYMKFKFKKKRIIAWISKNQNEYDTLNNQLYFFSEKIRTEVVHKGKSILDIVTIENANKIINSLFLIIYRFACKVIESHIYFYDDLVSELESSRNKFEEKKAIMPTIEENVEVVKSDNGIEHIFLIPISNFKIDRIIHLGDMIFIPRQYNLELLKDEDINISEEIVAEIRNSQEITTLINKAVVAVFKDKYIIEGEWYPEKEFSFLEILTKKVNRYMNYIILKHCKINNSNIMPSIARIIDGFGQGIMINTKDLNIRGILGKIYCLYSDSKEELVLENCISEKEDSILYQLLYAKRNDEVYMNCREAISRICEAMYINNYSISIIHMFDTLDMLEPLHFNEDKMRTHVVTFISNSRNQYRVKMEELKNISEKYRKYLFHYGKDITQLCENRQEIYILFEKISDIIIDYCKNVILLNVTTLGELYKARIDRYNSFK